MTQERLADELYSFDMETFEGLTPVTLSRWERGLSRTSKKRMQSVISYFQTLDGRPLPCIDSDGMEDSESVVCTSGLSTLFKSGKMVVDLPIEMVKSGRTFEISSLRHHPRAGELIELNHMLHLEANTETTRVGVDRFEEWMENPANLFTTVTFGDSFLGLLFSLRLKPESFDRVISFDMRKEDISEIDFASADERASIYLLSFFSLSRDVGSMLFSRLYASLIAGQERIDSIGFVSSFEEAMRLANEMNLKISGASREDGKRIVAYRASLFEVMSSPHASKILFPKGECP